MFRSSARRLGCGSLLALTLMLGGPARAAIWPSSVTRAEAELGSSDATARLAAVQRLAELPRASARRLLLRALDDTDSRVASAALELLLRLETPNVTERVVPWLSGSDKRLRLSAALSLAVDPAPSAVPALGRALSDSDPEVRAAAAAALGASRSEAAVLPLLGHLDDSVPEVREAVANALGTLGDARAVLPLIGKIEDARPPVRAAVARALGSLRDPRSASALLLSLRDSDRGVVVAVVRALGALGESSAVAPLSAQLSASPDPETRRALLSALGRIGNADAAKALLKALSFDEPGREREAALAALELAPAAFTPPLRECLDSALEPGLAEGCALGLAQVRDTPSAARVRAALDRGQLAPKVGLRVLAKLGDARALSAALERLTVPDAETRAAALDAAEALLSPKDVDGRAVEPLARALAARVVSRTERLRLVGLLGRTGSERALPTLLPLLPTLSDPELAESAAAALGNVPGPVSGRALLAALRAEEPRVRRAAALSIRQNGDASLLAPLLALAEQGGRRDRELAYLALPGPLSHTTDDVLLTRAVRLQGRARGSERDEWLEALSASARAPARRALLEVTASADSADRAKAAELLSSRPDVAALSRLARDPDVRVRQNAVWSLGFASAADSAAARAALEPALKDRDAAVIGNAAVALGRLGHAQPLCGELLNDPRATVREQALRGLLLAGIACVDLRWQRLLAMEPRARVRRAAAELLRRVAATPADQRLLQRCEEGDPNAVVAETCAGPPRAPAADPSPLTLLIVPSAGAEPTPGAAFSLLLPDGGLRLGSADRRGGVHEARAPRGATELLPYAGGD